MLKVASDGLTEELIDLMTRIPDIRVPHGPLRPANRNEEARCALKLLENSSAGSEFQVTQA